MVKKENVAKKNTHQNVLENTAQKMWSRKCTWKYGQENGNQYCFFQVEKIKGKKYGRYSIKTLSCLSGALILILSSD